MSQACVILSEKRYTQKAQLQAKEVTDKVNHRFNRWVVSLKHLLDQEDVDDLFSSHAEFADSVIMNEKERVTPYQRLLLDVEKNRVHEKKSELAAKQKRYKLVVDDVKEKAIEMMNDKLSNPDLKKLVQFPEAFSYLISFAYTPTINFKKLHTIAEANLALSRSLIELANNDSFCKSLNKKPKNIGCYKTAIGFIGIDACKILFPILIIKPLLKWSDSKNSLIAPKLWQHAVITANVARMRLEDEMYKEPAEGMVLGMIRNIGKYIVHNIFSRTFEEALGFKMLYYRENSQMEEYYSCADISPKTGIIPDMMDKWGDELTLRIVNSIDWDRSSHLKDALIDDIENKSVLDRGVHGVALSQASAFSMSYLMNKSNAFLKEHNSGLFANSMLSNEDYRSIGKRNPARINLSSL
jgi:hypothetical protein